MLLALRRQWLTCSPWKVLFLLGLSSCVVSNSHLHVRALSLHVIIFISISRLFMFYLVIGIQKWANSSMHSIIPVLLEEYRCALFGTSRLLHIANIFMLPFMWLRNGELTFCETVESRPFYFKQITSFYLFPLHCLPDGDTLVCETPLSRKMSLLMN